MFDSPGPLSVGNVVSATLRLYRDRFKTYSSIALIACGWVLLPSLTLNLLGIIGGLVSGLLFGGLVNGDAVTVAITAIILLISILLWIAFLLYCVAKSLTNAGLISRLAFCELINKPETASQGREFLKNRTWQFLLSQFLSNLILLLVNFGLLIIWARVFNISATMMGNDFLGGLLFLSGSIACLVAYLWLYSRLFFPEAPLSVENQIDWRTAISRSWKLSQGYAGRIILIITIAILVTTPVYFIAGIPLFFSLVSLISSSLTGVDFAGVSRIFIGFFLSVILFILLNILALPFWQILKGIIYYDLRSRREGLGLELPDSF